MKKFWLFGLTALPLFQSCHPTDREIGQSVLFVTPAVFLIALGFVYLLFRLWKRKRPELTFSWRPNLIFLGALILVATLVVWWPGFDAANNKFCDSTVLGSCGLTVYAFVFAGPSFLTVIFIATRIWLSLNPSRAFTWAPILAMSVCVILTFPLLLSEGNTTYGQYVILYFWLLLGGMFELEGRDIGFPGLLTLLVFFILLREALLKKKNQAGEAEK